MTDRHQKTLPFAEAEGTRAERRALLGKAIELAGADCQLSVFLQWVFNVTDGGRADVPGLTKSYTQLGDRPWGLCCSRSKARATVVTALELGLITVEEAKYVTKGQRPNTYWLDWDGLRNYLGFKPRPRSDEVRPKPEGYLGFQPHPRSDAVRPKPDGCDSHPRSDAEPTNCNGGHGLPGVVSRHTPVATRQGPVVSRHTPVARRHPYKEETFFEPSLKTLPVPAPAPEAETERIFVFQDVPLLAEAVTQPVKPLPVLDRYGCGIFSDRVLAKQHLERDGWLIEWFRRQLSMPRPACRGNRAELLLVLASARHALARPAAEVKRNRVALFVHIVSRGHWDRVLGQLSSAERGLADLLKTYGPALLDGQTWPPIKLGELIAKN